MPSGIFTTDLEGRIITFNKSAQEIVGKSSSEVIGKSPKEIFPFLRDVDIREPVERIEGRIECGGKELSIGMRFSHLKNSEGRVIGMIGVFQDLTRLKAMESEMKRKEKWAFIGELSALIAHELRNPLASLKGSIEILREGKISERDAVYIMDIAISEMDRLNSIITDFLLYAKPQQLNRERFDLHQSLREVVSLLRGSELMKKDVKISENLAGELLIEGDQKQLRQIFWNLGVNALDAVSEGGSITISTERKDDSVEIVFSDSGVGISRENIDKVFYPFFTTKERGTGLGLAIAQRIAEDHGGRITAESNGVGTGATFRVILPINSGRES